LTHSSGIDPPFTGVYRVAKQDETLTSITVKKGERLFLDIAKANMDVSHTYNMRHCASFTHVFQTNVFPKPESVDTTRPRESYLHGDGCFKVLGEDLALKIMTEVVCATFSFNVRRGPNRCGGLPRFGNSDKTLPVLHYTYLNEKMLPSAWPTSMILNYDVSPSK